ncbi:MAG: DNA primase [Paraprevotella sp.]|nr:DNA primase [Paraprevotella sp.]
MIDRVTIDRILDAAQIVDVVSEFVTLKRAGANYKGLCPFHDDRTPSFIVSPAKGLCKCFACGKGGNAVHFIMAHEQLSYPDALRYLAKKYHIEIKEEEQTDEQKQAQSERESMFVVNEWARSYFQQQLNDTEDGRAIGMAYFRSRGFRDDIIQKFQLGFCPSKRNACSKEALSKGYNEEYLLSTGLCYKRDNGELQDRFSGRVIFPIHTLSGKTVGFGGRVLDAATKGVNIKYQNSPESAIYNKRRELYGLFQAKQAIVKNDLCYLVEGYTDVISMHQAGVENVVSSSGTALTTEQIRMIHRFTDNITVLYDGDAAGIKASERGIDMLLAEGMNVKLLLLPDGEDPDSFARKHNATEYQSYLRDNQVDFIRFKTNLLLEDAQGDPIKLSRLVNNIVQSIAVIPDEITRSVYTRETASMLSMDEKLLASGVSKQIHILKEEKKKQQANEQARMKRKAEDNATANSRTGMGLPSYYMQDSAVPPAPESAPWIPPTQEYTVTSEEEAIPPSAPLDFDTQNIPHEVAEEGTTGPTVPNTLNEDIKAERPSADVQGMNYVPQKDADQMMFYQKELLLIQVLVRYGECILCNMVDDEGNEKTFTVLEFVDFMLKQDKLEFRLPLHTQILNEGLAHLHENGFKAERFFVNHPNSNISNLAFSLSLDKEQLSKYHSKNQKIQSDEERLMELVPHLLTDLKLAIIQEELRQILQEMRSPSILTNKEKYMDLMKRFKDAKEVESDLAHKCGDRVVTR